MLSRRWLTASLGLAAEGRRHLRGRCHLAGPTKGAPALLEGQRCLTWGQGAEAGKRRLVGKGEPWETSHNLPPCRVRGASWNSSGSRCGDA